MKSHQAAAGLMLVLFWAGAVLPSHAQQVVHAPENLDTLQDRVAWATAESDSWSAVWIIRVPSSAWQSHRNRQTLAQLLGRESSDVGTAVVIRRERGSVVGVRTVSLGSNGYHHEENFRYLGIVSQEASFQVLSNLAIPDEKSRQRIHVYGHHPGVPAAGTAIRRALSSPRVNVRKAAAYALSHFAGEEAIPELKYVVGAETSIEVAKAAVYAIGNVEGELAVAALSDVVDQDTRREIRKAAVYALGNVGSASARAKLIHLAKTEQ